MQYVNSFQGSEELLKRANERSGKGQRELIDLNRSPPAESSSEREETARSRMRMISSEPMLEFSQSEPQHKNNDPNLMSSKKPYIYKPRKSMDELSQTRNAKKCRNLRTKIRENETEKERKVRLEKQRQRMVPILSKYKEDKIKFGFSSNPANVKKRQYRKNIKEGTATVEERQFIENMNRRARESRSHKQRGETIKILREKLRTGTITAAELEKIEKRKQSDRKYSSNRRKEFLKLKEKQKPDN